MLQAALRSELSNPMGSLEGVICKESFVMELETRLFMRPDPFD
jgi:hypothetical protein